MSEKRTFTLEPERAYGHRDENQYANLPFADFPEGIEVGMNFQAEMNGMPILFSISSIDEEAGTVT